MHFDSLFVSSIKYLFSDKLLVWVARIKRGNIVQSTPHTSSVFTIIIVRWIFFLLYDYDFRCLANVACCANDQYLVYFFGYVKVEKAYTLHDYMLFFIHSRTKTSGCYTTLPWLKMNFSSLLQVSDNDAMQYPAFYSNFLPIYVTFVVSLGIYIVFKFDINLMVNFEKCNGQNGVFPSKIFLKILESSSSLFLKILEKHL